MATGKALVTGGAGFIGSHLVERLLSLGREVTIVDDLSTGRATNLRKAMGDKCRLVQGKAGPLLAGDASLLEGVSEVYHLAAAVGVKLVVDDPVSMIQNNVVETATVLDAVARSGARVLIASTSEVYGKNPNLPLVETHDILYGPTSAPRWAYGMSKAMDEHLALAMQNKNGLKPVIVRLFNTIGPRQVGHYGMVVPRFVQKAVAGQTLDIHGDGRQTRAFCDARDVVEGMTRLLAEDSSIGQVFNLGNDQQITIEALADRVLSLSGSKSGKRFVTYESVYGGTFEDPRDRVPDLTKIRKAIGFSPRYTLDATLTELIHLAREELGATGGAR